MRSARQFLSERTIYYSFLLFVGICALGGGASRVDVRSQMIVQLAAIGLLAITTLSSPPGLFKRSRGISLYCAACVLLVAVQLVPLPPAIWTSLPGREFYAQAASVVHIEQPWRPISLSPSLGWSALASLLPPLAAAAALSATNSERNGRYLTVVALLAVTSAILGLAQLLGGVSSPLRLYAVTNQESPVGLFANRNHQAIFLAIGIPALACWARLNQKEAAHRSPHVWVSMGAILFLAPTILLTGSRQGVGLGILSIAFAAYFMLASKPSSGATPRVKNHSGRRQWRRLAMFALPFAILTVVILLSVLSSRAIGLDRLFETDVRAESRFLVIKPLWNLIIDFFPVGSGFGTFDPVFRRVEPFGMLSQRYMNQAHNDLLQLAMEGGLAGLLLLAVFLGWWARRTISVWRSRPGTSFSRLLMARLGTVATGMVLVSSLTDYPLRTPLFAVTFIIAAFWMMADTSAIGRRLDKDADI